MLTYYISIVFVSVMAHTHCMGPGPGPGPGQRQGTGWAQQKIMLPVLAPSLCSVYIT